MPGLRTFSLSWATDLQQVSAGPRSELSTHMPAERLSSSLPHLVCPAVYLWVSVTATLSVFLPALPAVFYVSVRVPVFFVWLYDCLL